MYYAAYGSNMNYAQMDFRCPNSRVIGRGYVPNHRLVFNYHADMIPALDSKIKTPVLIWNIDSRDWNTLDRYEGFPKYYVKKIVNVETEEGKNIECIAYVMADDRKGFDLPSIEYFNTIKNGYLDNHISIKHLRDAIKYTESMMENIEI